jgi:hypothetical protein
MTENEIERLLVASKRAHFQLQWAFANGERYSVVSMTKRQDDPSPLCANLSSGYIALDNCDLSDFYLSINVQDMDKGLQSFELVGKQQIEIETLRKGAVRSSSRATDLYKRIKDLAEEVSAIVSRLQSLIPNDVCGGGSIDDRIVLMVKEIELRRRQADK